MKAQAEASEFAEALSWVDAAVGTKVMHPALSGVVVAAEEGKLTFKASDIETSATTSIPAAIDEPGSILAPRRLAALGKRLPDKPVHLDAPSELYVSCGRIKATLSLMSLDDFPNLPKVESDPIQLSSYTLERVAKHIAPFCGKPGKVDKAFLTGVGVVVGDGRALFGASDQYRFQLLTTQADGECRAIVPPALFTAGFDGPMDLELSKDHAALSDAQRRLTSALIQGTYPDMMPALGGVQVTVERDELLASLSLLTTVSGEANAVAKLSLEESMLVVEGGRGSDAVSDAIECMASEDVWDVYVNPAFLASQVKTHQVDSVTLSQDGHMRPIVVASDDEGLTSVLMPVSPKG